MQHSLVSSLSSQASRGLVRLRKHSRQVTRHAARLAVGGAMPCAVLASAAAAGAPDSGRDSSAKQQAGKKPDPLDFGSHLRRMTDGVLVLNTLLFLANWASKDVLMLWGAKVNSLIAAGQLWRLVTCNFLHINAIHFLINSHALNSIGPHAELLLGQGRFTAVYLMSAVAGTAASFVLNPTPSVGASAALYGLVASLAVFYWRHRHSMGRRSEVVLQQLGVTLAINMTYSLAMSRRIDNWGHLGGLAGGALVTWLLGPRLVRDPSSGLIVDRPPVPLLAHKPLTGHPPGGK